MTLTRARSRDADRRAALEARSRARSGTKRAADGESEPVSSKARAGAGGAGGGGGDEFSVNVRDARFAKLFDGDASFAVERTAREFHETDGMRAILGEQRRRRDAAKGARVERATRADDAAVPAANDDELGRLIATAKRRAKNELSVPRAGGRASARAS